VGADAGPRREFVDAFLADEGRIHVGEQQFLAPPRRRLDDRVDRRARQRGAQLDARPRERGAVAFEEEIGGDARRQPSLARISGQGLRGAGDRGVAEPGEQGIGDEGGDDGS